MRNIKHHDLQDKGSDHIRLIKIIITQKGKILTIFRNHNQALRVMKWIPFAKSTSEFIINGSAHTSRIIDESKVLIKSVRAF